MTKQRLSEAGQAVRQHDHDRYLTALFAKPERREELFALYAFNHEVAKTSEVVSESIIGQIRLQWWRDALESLLGGNLRQHYVLQGLEQAAKEGRLAGPELERLIDARERDLEARQPQDLEEFEAYAEATGATLLRAALGLLELAPDHHRDLYRAARHIGIAYATVGILRAVPFHAARRQIFLPEDHLAVAGVDTPQLLELQPQERLSGVVMRLSARAQEHLDEARKLIPSSKDGAPVLLHGSLAGLYLERLASVHYDPFSPKAGLAPPSRMLRLTWLCWRGRW